MPKLYRQYSGLTRSASVTFPGALPRLVVKPWLDPTGTRSWPLGMGFVRSAWNVSPLSLVTGTGVLRE